MKEKEIGKLLISWDRETDYAWSVDIKIRFWHTLDVEFFGRRLIIEWD